MRPAAPTRGGRKPRDKGSRFERSLVRLFQDHGLAAERVPPTARCEPLVILRLPLAIEIATAAERAKSITQFHEEDAS
jgi:Holliday junction resolvase